MNIHKWQSQKGKNECFAEILDKSIQIAESRLKKYGTTENEAHTREQLKVLVQSLQSDRDEVMRGEVEPYQGQLFGPMKFVIDWGEPGESELLVSLYDIELFYRENY